MKQLLENLRKYLRRCKVWMDRSRVLVPSLVVCLFVAWGVYCFLDGFANQAMGYFLSPFILGQLVLLRHAWLPVGVVRGYDELIQRFTPPLLLDPAVIRSLILAGPSRFSASCFTHLFAISLASCLSTVFAALRNPSTISFFLS
jgi:hypothetical protein